ncbi:hypothetical protein [Aquimarina mytili]|uniref:Uncharacterized protein n=1 Tax=Aquimarina mytili TaxID=874423 RepID=A0A937A247_9FLAO|nr:hypothetical protein [Aquimarina mytili]MBL0683014.1 hypothetical protein [Aquimarina mytili]
MKQFILPISLISFAVICLSIVHIDNVNKLESQSDELRKKHQNDVLLENKTNHSVAKDDVLQIK